MKNAALVLGGSGFVGRHVCEQLAALGWAVTVPTRRRESTRALWTMPGVTVVEASVHDPAALRRLVAGHSVVINLVAVLHGTEARFEQVHVDLPRQLAQACLAQGCQHLVHISALGAHAQGPSMYQRSKARGEAAACLPGLSVTVLRPSVIFGAGDALFNLFARIAALTPVLPLAGAHTRMQPVWVQDVATAIVRAVRDPAAAGGVYELAGPDVMTLAEMVHLAASARRQRATAWPRVLPLPWWLAHWQAWAMECLPGEPLMSRDNVASLTQDNLATPGMPGLADLGVANPASPRDVVPATVGAPSVYNRLRLTARR
jgi:NADH dehydrogenase